MSKPEINLKEVKREQPKLPHIGFFKAYNEDPLIIRNEEDFPDYVFSWTSEDEFEMKKNAGWCFVTDDMKVISNGTSNELGRIAFKEMTLMYHLKEFMELRNKAMREMTIARTSNIKKKIQNEAEKSKVEIVDPRTGLKK